MSGFLPTDLIKEVKIRPGIYNKAALIPPRRQHRQQLWLEVAESLTPPQEWEGYTNSEKEIRIGEVSNKWKNLRDHFYREIKLLEAGLMNKKRKYIYYDDMEFVRPYIGYKQPPAKKREKRSFETLNITQECEDIDSDFDMEDFLKSSDKVQDGKTKVETNNKLKREHLPKTSPNKASSSTSGARRAQKEVIIKNFGAIKKAAGVKNPTFKIRESDLSFCLSLVPTLRQMPDIRKLSVKIDILKVLRRNMDQMHHDNTINQDLENEESEGEYEEYNVKDDPLNSSDTM